VVGLNEEGVVEVKVMGEVLDFDPGGETWELSPMSGKK
jgi:hypothetical protein